MAANGGDGVVVPLGDGENDPYVYGLGHGFYRTPLQSAMRGYVSNAARAAAAAHGHVDVILPSPDRPALIVADTGRGMTRDELLGVWDMSLTGASGLPPRHGFRSGLAVADRFHVSTTRDGVRVDAVIQRGTDGSAEMIVGGPATAGDAPEEFARYAGSCERTGHGTVVAITPADPQAPAILRDAASTVLFPYPRSLVTAAGGPAWSDGPVEDSHEPATYVAEENLYRFNMLVMPMLHDLRFEDCIWEPVTAHLGLLLYPGVDDGLPPCLIPGVLLDNSWHPRTNPFPVDAPGNIRHLLANTLLCQSPEGIHTDMSGERLTGGRGAGSALFREWSTEALERAADRIRIPDMPSAYGCADLIARVVDHARTMTNRQRGPITVSGSPFDLHADGAGGFDGWTTAASKGGNGRVNDIVHTRAITHATGVRNIIITCPDEPDEREARRLIRMRHAYARTTGMTGADPHTYITGMREDNLNRWDAHGAVIIDRRGYEAAAANGRKPRRRTATRLRRRVNAMAASMKPTPMAYCIGEIDLNDPAGPDMGECLLWDLNDAWGDERATRLADAITGSGSKPTDIIPAICNLTGRTILDPARDARLSARFSDEIRNRTTRVSTLITPNLLERTATDAHTILTANEQERAIRTIMAPYDRLLGKVLGHSDRNKKGAGPILDGNTAERLRAWLDPNRKPTPAARDAFTRLGMDPGQYGTITASRHASAIYAACLAMLGREPTEEHDTTRLLSEARAADAWLRTLPLIRSGALKPEERTGRRQDEQLDAIIAYMNDTPR